ncbi:MAG: ribosome maturation factor RimM [Woeseiaceae bacterium]
MTAEPVVLGRIAGLFGVKGWVKVFSYTDPREAVLQHKLCSLRQDGRLRAVRLVEGKRHGKSVIARIDGIDDRDAAAALIGGELVVSRDALPQTAPGEYYWRDLEGLKVLRTDGTELGTVAYLLETGAHDVLVVQGDKERLIPFVQDKVIQDVDLAAGTISVDWEWD